MDEFEATTERLILLFQASMIEAAFYAPSAREDLEALYNAGLVTPRTDEEANRRGEKPVELTEFRWSETEGMVFMEVTERGRTYIRRLLRQPLPIQAWGYPDE